MSDAVEEGVSDEQSVADAITRPENVPEKFWNDETKTTNNDAVLESYNQLSSKHMISQAAIQQTSDIASGYPANI